MKICHVCGACCEDEAELCYVCGAEFLSDDETDANIDGEDFEAVLTEPVLAASLEDLVSAQIFCDMLAENRIPYSMGDDTDNIGMQIAFGGAFAEIDIYVDKANYKRAQEVYEQFMSEEQQIEDFDDFDDFEDEQE